MRILLRLIAGWAFVNAVATVPGLWRLGKLAMILRDLGMAAFVACVAFLGVLALTGSVALWRLTQRGRLLILAYAILLALGLVTMRVRLFMSLEEVVTWKGIAQLALAVAAAVLLASPSARATCSHKTPEGHPPDNNEMQLTRSAIMDDMRGPRS